LYRDLARKRLLNLSKKLAISSPTCTENLEETEEQGRVELTKVKKALKIII